MFYANPIYTCYEVRKLLVFFQFNDTRWKSNITPHPKEFGIQLYLFHGPLKQCFITVHVLFFLRLLK